MLGKLTREAIPFDQPIALFASLIVLVVLGAIALYTLWRGWWSYLWREWIVSVDHKRLGIMYALLALVMLVRGFIDALMMRSQQALAAGNNPVHAVTLTLPGARSFLVHVARLPGAPSRGAVVVFHDDSELRRLERLRQEFVANVSHELKTPLAIIKACIETLIDGGIADPPRRMDSPRWSHQSKTTRSKNSTESGENVGSQWPIAGFNP